MRKENTITTDFRIERTNSFAQCIFYFVLKTKTQYTQRDEWRGCTNCSSSRFLAMLIFSCTFFGNCSHHINNYNVINADSRASKTKEQKNKVVAFASDAFFHDWCESVPWQCYFRFYDIIISMSICQLELQFSLIFVVRSMNEFGFAWVNRCIGASAHQWMKQCFFFNLYYE